MSRTSLFALVSIDLTLCTEDQTTNPLKRCIPMSVENSVDLLIAMRIAERGLIVAIILVVTVYLMIVLSREIQKINLNLDTSAGAAKASVTVAMPVFLLLVLILFSYVAFSTPVSFSEKTTIRQEVGDSKQLPVEREVQIVGYQGLDRDVLLDIRALTSLLNDVAELSILLRPAEADRDWQALEESIMSAVAASIKIAEHRMDLSRILFGDDILRRCGGELSSKYADDSYSVSSECSEFVEAMSREL